METTLAQVIEWLWEILQLWGVPGALVGLIIWFFKRKLDERDRKAEEREASSERFMRMVIHELKANYILSEATARAVQRIPDAHCNGDMTKALEDAKKTMEEEEAFLVDKGVEHIFRD